MRCRDKLFIQISKFIWWFPFSPPQSKKVPPDWERGSFQQASQASPDLKPSPQNGATFPSSGGYGQGSLIADEESQEFDDLIFALKTGMYEPTNYIRNGHYCYATLYIFLPWSCRSSISHPQYILILMTHPNPSLTLGYFVLGTKYNTT